MLDLSTIITLEWRLSALWIAAFVLILSSAFYVPFESRSRQGTKAARLSRMAQALALVSVLVFLLLVALDYPTLARAWKDIMPVIAAIALVHSIRFTLDLKQAAKLERPKPGVSKLLLDGGRTRLLSYAHYCFSTEL